MTVFVKADLHHALRHYPARDNGQSAPDFTKRKPDRSRIKTFDIHAEFVYTIAMIKNITLSADEALIEQARQRAMTGEHNAQRSISRLAGALCGAARRCRSI
jgi:hypothetical protein